VPADLQKTDDSEEHLFRRKRRELWISSGVIVRLPIVARFHLQVGNLFGRPAITFAGPIGSPFVQMIAFGPSNLS
jgi:hypothetical protein